MPTPRADLTMSAGSEPCEHCPDCGKTPCPDRAQCTAPCAVSLPQISVAGAELPRLAVGKPIWPTLATSLRGEHPPPDPFPPRA